VIIKLATGQLEVGSL